jgi:hypothetical protein
LRTSQLLLQEVVVGSMNASPLPPAADATGTTVPDGLVHGRVTLTKPATTKQRRVLQFIHEYTQRRGFAPGLRDIAAAFGLTSTNAVNCHLVQLERRGLIVREHLLSRSLRLTIEGYALLGVRAEVDAPPRAQSAALHLELVAARKEAARLRTLLYRVERASFADLPAILRDIRAELSE